MLKPYGSKLLIKPSRAIEKIAKGLLIADTIKSKLQTTQGRVIAIGNGVKKIGVGTLVVYAFGVGYDVDDGDTRLLVLSEADVVMALA